MTSRITLLELANEFALPLNSIEQKLVDLKLKSKHSKLATKYAVQKNLATVVDYCKEGKKIKLTFWNRESIKYIERKSLNDFNFWAEILLGTIKNLKEMKDELNTISHNINWPKYTLLQEDFLNKLHKTNNNMQIFSLFIQKLECERLIDFALTFNEIKDLNIILAKYNLQKLLSIKTINNLYRKKTKI